MPPGHRLGELSGDRPLTSKVVGERHLSAHNRVLAHLSVLLAAVGLLLMGLLSASRGGVQTVSSSAGVWPSPAAFQAGQYYDKPAAVPGSIKALPAPTITVSAGETLQTVAAKYDTTPDELAWANGLGAASQPAVGQSILIPPAGQTVLVRVLPGETLSAFASRFRVSSGVVLNYNNLNPNASLSGGSFLLMPSAVSPTSLPSADFQPVRPGVPEVVPSQPDSPNPFPWGQCTYWVASQRYVPWQGNAVNWWANAQGFGAPEGQVPIVGAIAVYALGYYGHVALVTSVLSNGDWVQSEMNVQGLGVVDHRTMSPGEDNLIGFIY